VRATACSGPWRSSPTTSCYADSVGAALKWFEELAGNQPNDPRRVAEAIIAAVEADEPPLRLVLGEEAFAAVREKLEAQRQELEAWADLATRTASAR
jgi:hypothetical protein